jgi:hypothetical protein
MTMLSVEHRIRNPDVAMASDVRKHASYEFRVQSPNAVARISLEQGSAGQAICQTKGCSKEDA